MHKAFVRKTIPRRMDCVLAYGDSSSVRLWTVYDTVLVEYHLAVARHRIHVASLMFIDTCDQRMDLLVNEYTG